MAKYEIRVNKKGLKGRDLCGFIRCCNCPPLVGKKRGIGCQDRLDRLLRRGKVTLVIEEREE